MSAARLCRVCRILRTTILVVLVVVVVVVVLHLVHHLVRLAVVKGAARLQLYPISRVCSPTPTLMPYVFNL